MIVVGTLIAAAFYLPSIGVCALLAGMASVALLEFYGLLNKAGIPSFRVVGVIAGVFMIVVTWATLSGINGIGIKNADLEQLALFLTVIVLLIRLFPQKHNTQPLATVACTLLGVLYVPMLFNFFTKLAFTWGETSPLRPVSADGRILAFYLICVVKCTDTGAYFIGSRFGRRKLFPRISPAKTWEGFYGGVATGFLAGTIYFALFQDVFSALNVGWGKAAALSAILPFMGTVGDLTESMLKRAASVKDSDSIIPGMGGMLDVVDSLLFAVPAMYFFIKLSAA